MKLSIGRLSVRNVAFLLFCGIVGVGVGIVLTSEPKISRPVGPRLEHLRDTIYASANVFPVLYRAGAKNFSTNWVDFRDVADEVGVSMIAGFSAEVISVSRTNRHRVSSTVDGLGGWFFDTNTLSLHLNLTNLIVIELPSGGILRFEPKAFQVDSNGISFRIPDSASLSLARSINRMLEVGNSLPSMQKPSSP